MNTHRTHPHTPPQNRPLGSPLDPRRARMRAGDADRDAVITALGDALAEGRLDPAEHGHRLTLAATATTLGRLADLTADLPPSATAETRRQAAAAKDRRAADWRAWLREGEYWLGGAFVMTLIWAVQSLKDHDWAFYWPAVPLGIWAAILLTYLIWPEDPDRHAPGHTVGHPRTGTRPGDRNAH